MADALEQMAGVPATQSATNGAAAPVPMSSFLDPNSFDLIQRVAKVFASSDVVPERYKGKLPNCIIAIDMANRLGAGVIQVMQSLYIVHGNPGWSAKFLIASFNQCGRFSAIRYKWQGEKGTDSWGCLAWATEKSTGETIEGPEITIALAKKEGWYSKSGSKWQSIPQLMLMYRAAAWLINTHAPEISMGLRTAEENEDIELEPRPDGSFAAATGEPRSRSDALASRLGLQDTDNGNGSNGHGAEVDQDPDLVERVNNLIISLNNFEADEPDAGTEAFEACTSQRSLDGLSNEQLTEAEKFLGVALKQKEQKAAAANKKPAGKTEQLGLGGKSEI